MVEELGARLTARDAGAIIMPSLTMCALRSASLSIAVGAKHPLGRACTDRARRRLIWRRRTALRQGISCASRPMLIDARHGLQQVRGMVHGQSSQEFRTGRIVKPYTFLPYPKRSICRPAGTPPAQDRRNIGMHAHPSWYCGVFTDRISNIPIHWPNPIFRGDHARPRRPYRQSPLRRDLSPSDW